MTYDEVLQYLYSQVPQFQLVGSEAYHPGLDSVLLLDSWCGAPHKAFASIHVAGTNGKGSTSHMLASVLQSAGYRVGLYTSPHLKDFRERIRVDGQMIDRDFVVSFVEKYRRAKELPPFPADFQPSFFELTTELAFCYFAARKVDVAIIEVGLGGRFDSTNIIRPLVSVIAHVSFDHMAILGDTLEQIAGEKAGIAKRGVPLVLASNGEVVRGVVEGQCVSVGAPLHYAPAAWRCQSRPQLPGQVFDFHRLPGAGLTASSLPCCRDVYCDLGGNYIADNVLSVLTTLDLIAAQFPVGESALREGLADVIGQTGIRGRWEILGEHPLRIADTGHNEDCMDRLMAQLAETPHRRLHLVLGFVKDKDVDAMLRLMPSDAAYYFANAPIPRALSAAELAEKAGAYGLKGCAYPSVGAAYKAALDAAEGEDVVFVGGSNFTVSEIL